MTPPRRLAVSAALALLAALLAASASAQPVPALEHAVIPAPAEVTMGPGDPFVVTAETPIAVEAGNAEVLRIGRMLSDLMGTDVAEARPAVVEVDAAPPGSIHLTTEGSDDQGWRVEIAGWPRLTETGGSTEVGGGPGGFYTAADYAGIVRYAAERFVTVVPEIDVPGHTNAAFASYPELTCTGEAPPLYTGTRVGFSTLCVEKEEVYTFLDGVVGALAALTPGPYFHLGGDEVRELSAEQYGQFMARAQAIVASHGKRVVGWDEIAEVDLLPGTVVQVWRPQAPTAAEAVAQAVAEGAQVVLSPSDRIYLDIKYDSTTALGLTWAGLNGVRDAYDWEPATLVAGVPESAVLGVEAPLWSETLATMADVWFMAFPRLPGVAEIGWSRPEARGWDGYRLRLARHAPRWTALGVTYFRSPEVPWD